MQPNKLNEIFLQTENTCFCLKQPYLQYYDLFYEMEIMDKATVEMSQEHVDQICLLNELIDKLKSNKQEEIMKQHKKLKTFDKETIMNLYRMWSSAKYFQLKECTEYLKQALILFFNKDEFQLNNILL